MARFSTVKAAATIVLIWLAMTGALVLDGVELRHAAMGGVYGMAGLIAVVAVLAFVVSAIRGFWRARAGRPPAP